MPSGVVVTSTTNSRSDSVECRPRNSTTNSRAWYIQKMKMNKVTKPIQPSSRPPWATIVPNTPRQLSGSPHSRRRLTS